MQILHPGSHDLPCLQKPWSTASPVWQNLALSKPTDAFFYKVVITYPLTALTLGPGHDGALGWCKHKVTLCHSPRCAVSKGLRTGFKARPACSIPQWHFGRSWLPTKFPWKKAPEAASASRFCRASDLRDACILLDCMSESQVHVPQDSASL